MKQLTSCVSSTAPIHIALLNMLRMDKAHTQFFLYQIFAFASLEPEGNTKTSHENPSDDTDVILIFNSSCLAGGKYLHFWLYLIAQMLISF